MNPYALLPFAFELVYDWIAIYNGKKDLHWGFRLPMMLLTSIGYTYPVTSLHLGNLLLCVLPFLFFDICLNLLRGKKWDYLSTTNGKYWDRNLVRLNPYFLLVVRFVLAGLIVWIVL